MYWAKSQIHNNSNIREGVQKGIVEERGLQKKMSLIRRLTCRTMRKVEEKKSTLQERSTKGRGIWTLFI